MTFVVNAPRQRHGDLSEYTVCIELSMKYTRDMKKGTCRSRQIAICRLCERFPFPYGYVVFLLVISSRE